MGLLYLVGYKFSKQQEHYYLSIFYEVRKHDYSPTLSVIDHFPHVPSRGLHGALSYDVGLLLLVALHMVTALRA